MRIFSEAVDEYAIGLIKLLDKESERGCVLVASAYLEDAVRRLLFAYCRSISDVEDADLNKLFKTFDSQFANFASCIRLCRALGLFDDEDQTILLNFGAWRNGFAHGTGDKQITDEDTKGLMGATEGNVQLAVDTAAIEEFEKHPKPRQRFMVWVAVMLAGLHEFILELQAIKRPPRSLASRFE